MNPDEQKKERSAAPARPDIPAEQPEGVRQRAGKPLGHKKSKEPPADRGMYEQESTSQGSE